MDDYRNNEEYIKDLFQKRIIRTEGLDTSFPFFGYAIDYLKKKFIRIRQNYDFLIYKKQEDLFENSTNDQFNDFIINDKSHVTRKVRQTLNYIKKTNQPEFKKFWVTEDPFDVIKIDQDSMLKLLSIYSIDLYKLSPSELIELALPGFFYIDFVFENYEGSEIEFSKLSSGEQQMILNNSAITYHLNNIISIPHDTTRIAYENVNITLDEIELYFHPEMQRQLIYEVLNSLNTIRSGAIKSINLCFVTHSPFILSDIPVSNCMFLEVDKHSGKAVQRKGDELKGLKTFGANIHDLLAHGFFLENSFMGEFAKQKIEETIRFLDFKSIAKRIEEIDSISDGTLKEKDRTNLNEEKKNLENKKDALVQKGFNGDNEYHLSLIIILPPCRTDLLSI